jgi:SAM-dependent methyltransferase
LFIVDWLRARKARKRPNVPRRSQYREVWDRQSESEQAAKIAVSGYDDEGRYLQAGLETRAMLQDCVGIKPEDVVLEIGAGVGRVGAVLAPLCREWIGAEVSENMLNHMSQRLQAHANVRTVLLNGHDLAPIASESVDLVYCTVVFMHLEEWDRYGYILEGMRVLRPGGRMLVDNVNLLSDQGWAFFEEHRAIPPHLRPPHISKVSTAQEVGAYFSHAGFEGIEHRRRGIWLVTHGVKPLPQTS